MRFLAVFVLLHSSFVFLGAAEPPTTPLLRIETGMHTAQIRRVATDATGRLALTCSDDKTARLWRLPALKSDIANPKSELLRTFRTPIGSGDEGKLFACALAPLGILTHAKARFRIQTICFGETDPLRGVHPGDSASLAESKRLTTRRARCRLASRPA